MTDGVFWPNRRGVLAGLGSTILEPHLPAWAAPGRAALTLQARPGAAALRERIGGYTSLVAAGPNVRPRHEF